MSIDSDYTVENAHKYLWGSITGHLCADRVELLEKLLLGPKVLDAGCGGGAYVEYLVRKGYFVTGIDKYKDFLEVDLSLERRGYYVQCDLNEIPLPSKSFDSTYCFDVLEHLDDVAVIKELARVTTKRMVLAVPREDEVMTRYGLTFFHYQDKTHLRNYTEDSLRELIVNIPHSSFQILPELYVPAAALVLGMVKMGPLDSISAKIRRRAFMWLSKKVELQSINTGLVAIVDLQSV